MHVRPPRRVRVMLEVLRGIRAIKAAAWERLFAARVGRERRAELAALATRKYLDALCVYFWWGKEAAAVVKRGGQKGSVYEW